MRVSQYRLLDSFLIVPNIDHFFGEVRNQENGLDIIGTFAFKNVADIYLTRLGAIGFRFLATGPMQSIDRLQTAGSGIVPQAVMDNHDEVVELQGRRVTFANFIAAALFGRLMALRHTALTGAQYVGMGEIVVFAPSGGCLALESTRYSSAAIAPKTRFVTEDPRRVLVIPPDQISAAIAFVAHIAEREDAFEYANLQACVVMNYQAAILHTEQHSAASLALNFAVAEALIHEIFLAYGIVGSRTPRPFATRAHNVPNIPDGQFGRLKLAQRLSMFSDGGLMAPDLYQRLNEARRLRNGLMHSAAAVSASQAGTMQTAVRDLWSYMLGEEFELVSGWSMRM